MNRWKVWYWVGGMGRVSFEVEAYGMDTARQCADVLLAPLFGPDVNRGGMVVTHASTELILDD